MSVGAYLDCDGCGYAPFADSGPGAVSRMRAEAKEKGWRRVRRDGRVRDECPTCHGRPSGDRKEGE